MAKIDNHFLLSLLGVSLSLILLIPVASAVSVDESQESIVLVLERGTTYEFPLLAQDIEKTATIKASGEISDWIAFGEDKDSEYEIYPSYLTKVLVSITIPDDAELGEYEGEIEADSMKLSSLEIKVTLELSDAKAYEQLSDVDEEVGRLKEKVESMTDSMNSMRVQLATLEEEVSDKMQDIYAYQKNLTALENEKSRLESEKAEIEQNLKNLQAKSEGLEESNRQLNEMTGMLVGTQLPGMFFGGIILGVIAVTLIVKRAHVAKKIKSRVQRVSGRGKEEKFRYRFSG